MTKLVGIVNLTPDSFSDGGAHATPESALEAIHQQMTQGACIVDIGAESTRPGATPLSAEEEWQRLSSVLSRLEKLRFSVDTRHAEVAQRALAAGAHWINDVSGFSDPAMVAAVKDSDCLLVAMHSLSVPADKNIVMQSADVVAELVDWARAKIDSLVASGIARERIIIDPGIGFGKTAEQSLAIIRNISAFQKLGVPLLVGHSRKSFLGAQDRDAATLDISRALALQGVDYLRVHDVAAHRAMLEEAA